MKSIRVEQPKGPFKLVEEKIRRACAWPGSRIKVQGVAESVVSDSAYERRSVCRESTYPRSPGHEIAGADRSGRRRRG